MREIKFRGKSTTDNEYVEKDDWVFGYYYYGGDGGYIVSKFECESGGIGPGLIYYHIPVDTDSVGQYINDKDKNGKESYEGDIIKEIFIPLGARKESEYSNLGVIVFDDGSFGIKWKITECKYFNLPDEFKDNKFCQPYRKKWISVSDPNWIETPIYPHRKEILGNIYENPELLKD